MSNQIVKLDGQRAVAAVPEMPTAHRHRSALATEYPIDHYSALIPLDELKEARRELVEALAPSPSFDVERCVAALVAAYPQRGPAVPDLYIAAMAADLESFPPDIVRAACIEARRTIKFLPSIAEVYGIAERLTGERRRMVRNAEAMQREHARRQAEAEKREQEKRAEAERDATIERRLAELGTGAPRLGEYLLAEKAMRFGRAGRVTDRWETTRGWSEALFRREPWAFVVCRLGALAQIAIDNPIGPRARTEIITTAMQNETDARALLEHAMAALHVNADADEMFGIRLSPECQALVSELLDRERIEAALAGNHEPGGMSDAA